MVYPETFTGIAVTDYDNYLNPKKIEFTPRVFRDTDVDVEIEACGVCGSDIHAASGNWGRPYAPVIVGHEIIGTVVRVGPKAKAGIKVGDRVGVGAQCDCDDTCIACQKKVENYCRNNIWTYFGTDPESGVNTMGGNASHIRLNSKFAFKIPDGLETAIAAPLLCGGITGFSPLLENKVTKGTKVGVVGIGGIGHMTILFAKALGAEVTAISRSHSKEADAKKLGADHYVATSDPKDIEKHQYSLDLVINTGSSFSGSSLADVLKLLTVHGKFVFISAPPIDENLVVQPLALISPGLSVQGSALGSPEQIEYMLNFAAEHKIKPWVETVEINDKSLGEVWKRTEKGDVHYRFTMVGFDKYFKSK